ncbi:RNase adapter RapZ [Crassaminicella thermophila]|uniref:RNase adapter RapZ n=1 Tax=Crassaminicella thermophila TaxID=2599308 RepID=A0A5C0SAI5_CRATE|nr:RNase adapter RapZ [Crassaminicella thermophila]QEK11583.1 RNase adapter RapZ [Crassaminicella thermophila]
MKFVIITGLSGAGKSQAMKSMEDLGYYCVDNLPPALIPKFTDLCFHAQGEIEKIALVIDIRGGRFFDDLFKSLDVIKNQGYNYEILFLEASDEVLIKRFKETRRVHPINPSGRIIEGITKEREKLAELKKKAKYIVDTSNLTSAQLKEEIKKIYIEGVKPDNITIFIQSFGFKKGILLDADLVFDVRFLPNPHYIETLRDYTGNDKVVRDYVMKWPESIEFVEKLNDMIDFLIPLYIKEGKSQLVIGIGCTGGKHRSVTVANILYERLKDKGHRVIINHRDSVNAFRE